MHLLLIKQFHTTLLQQKKQHQPPKLTYNEKCTTDIACLRLKLHHNNRANA